jgi:chromosome partitioning protein
MSISKRPHVLSIINLKGGVGKTTTAVAVAEMLAQERKQKVLLIDLDPQTNATMNLITEAAWLELDKQGRTLAQLFEEKTRPHLEPRFDIERAIVRGVSTIAGGIPNLDLLPSSIKLIDLQDDIAAIPKDSHIVKSREILSEALAPVMNRYDYIIIDCPPSLGIVTKNGLNISNGYVIPTIPDLVSTWGVFQVVDKVSKFSSEIKKPIEALGIVATKVQGNTNLHADIMHDLARGRLGQFADGKVKQPRFFTNYISQCVKVAEGADSAADLGTFRMKYGPAYEQLLGLTQEIHTLCQARYL